MAKKDKFEITDKQSSIKQHMHDVLWLKNIIDANGKILDLDRFRAEIDVAISDCEVKMLKNSTVDGVVVDREIYSILVGEKEYLESLRNHTKNFDSLKERPIVSYEDLQKKNSSILFPKLRITGIILKERIRALLAR